MKRVVILTMFVICAMHAAEYSHRMIALGTDLANLIPDYETDLFRNPQILQKLLAGISHQPAYGYSYRIVPYPPIYVYVSPTPISLKLMTGNLGMMGEYWFDYRHDLELDTYGWLASTFQAYRLQDLWMSRMKNFVFNIYNDLDYSKVRYVTPTNLVSTARDLEYIIRTQAAFPVRKNLVLDIKIGFGFYEHKSEMSDYAFYDQRVNLGLARVGLFCRKIRQPMISDHGILISAVLCPMRKSTRYHTRSILQCSRTNACSCWRQRHWSGAWVLPERYRSRAPVCSSSG